MKKQEITFRIELNLRLNPKILRWGAKFRKTLLWNCITLKPLRGRPLPRFTLVLAIYIITPLLIYAVSQNKPYSFTSGQVISSSEVNENFDKLFEAAGRWDGSRVRFDDAVDVSALSINGSTVSTSTATYWSQDGSSRLTYGSGYVGIGTAGAPTSELQVRGDTDDNSSSSLNITNNSGTSMLYVRNDGRIGIGQTSPSQPLDVTGNANITGNLVVGGTISGTLSGVTVNNTNWTGTELAITNGGTGADNAGTALDNLGGVDIAGDTMTGALKIEGGSTIDKTSDNHYVRIGTSGGNHIALSNTQIQSKSNTTTESDLLLNPLGGNVGIGTSSPESHLAIRSTQPQLEFESDGTPNATDNGNILFTTGEAMRIRSTGIVNFFADTDDDDADSGSNVFNFTVNRGDLGGGGTRIMTMDDQANVDIPNGNLNIGSGERITWADNIDRGLICFSGQCDFSSTGTIDLFIEKDGNQTNQFFRVQTKLTPAGPTYNIFRVQQNGQVDFYDGSGGTHCHIADMDVTCTSDKRLKKEITPYDELLNKINKLKAVTFRLKDKAKYKIGLIAQDIQKAFPLAVHTNEQGYLMVDFSSMIAIAIQGVKDLRAEKDQEIETLRQQNRDLQSRLGALEEKINLLLASRSL